jgi:catechol 2,3-dioxygenase-like lactoylglutathione lyase family enzyme
VAMQAIARVTLLVREYDEAIAYFIGVLGFVLLEDAPMGTGKRWVVVGPSGVSGVSLLLARAATPEQASHIGMQGGGRVAFFLHTDDFRRDYEAMTARGVRFEEEPREEPYGTVAVFKDLYGNRWDLVQSRAAE